MKKINSCLIMAILLLTSFTTVTISNKSAAEGTDVSLTLNFEEGFNLVTIPVYNEFMASDLSENISGCLSISSWNAENQTYWPAYIVGGPASFDFEIKDGVGYFIDVEYYTNLFLEGSILENIQVSLLEGINLLGWYEEENNTASEVMGSIAGCIGLHIWDAVNQEYVFYNSTSDEDFTISQGMGFFVNVTQTGVWNGSALSNQPPYQPSKPSGIDNGFVGFDYDYTFSTTDPDNDDVSYYVDWGDGNTSGWSDFYNSGNSITMPYNWTEQGTYEVRVKSRDIEAEESIWSETLYVIISEEYNNPIVYVDDDADPSWYDETHVKTIQEGINNVSLDGVVFVFNGTYIENVIINKKLDLIGENNENVVIDGMKSGPVLQVTTDKINISRLTLKNSGPDYSTNSAIYINSSYNQITENIIHDNDCGIYLDDSNMNHISDNVIYSNYAEGMILIKSNGNTLNNNKIFDEHTSIFLMNSNNNNINNNEIFNDSSPGIFLSYSNNNDLCCNTIYKNYRGIYILNSDNNSLADNDLFDNEDSGILVYTSDNNSFLSNNLYNNSHDYSSIYAEIFISKSCNNQLSNNDIKSEKNCIGFYDYSIQNFVYKNKFLGGTCSIGFEGNCNNNTIRNNIVSNNSKYGIGITNSNNNTIYHNSFLNNTAQSYDDDNNLWYESTLEQGNYWDNYTGTDGDGDGIGDTPYNISGGENKDYYPLMEPYSPKIPTELQVSIATRFGLLFKKVSAKVENIGDEDADNVNLSIYVEYGLLKKKVNKSTEFSALEAGTISELLTVDGLRGFGKISVTAEAKAENADTVDTTVTGWIIGRLIILKP